ncbi:MAG: peptidylprolyl isomerase, partial [Dissulfurimicrobium sp.]|uniref:peptidylprolyl isomerase n=2 Tax=Dissulfurimicrobium sp. TaxID=2022436 RepID=UPI00404944B5
LLSIISIIFLVIFVFTLNAFCVIVDRIAAVVNGDVITLSELERSAEPLIKKNISDDMTSNEKEAKKKEIFKQVLTQLIDERLIEAEIKKLGIKVDNQDVDAAIERICKENNINMDEFVKKLASNGISLEDYKKDVKKRIESSQLISSEVQAKTVVTNEEVLAYLNESGSENTAGQGPFYVLQQILVVPKVHDDPHSRQDAQKKAEDALRAVKDGQKFEDVAQRYSDPPLDQAGVYLGTFAKKDMAKPIQEAISGLKAGQTTEVLDMPYGFQIIKIKEIIKNQAKSVDPAKMEMAREELYRKKINARFEEWINNLRSKATIRVLF